MATIAEKQAAKLEFSLRTFEANCEFMLGEMKEEQEKIVLAGASAYATSAQRHTPPSLGQPKIAEMYYEDLQSDHVFRKGEKTGGRRVIYKLRDIVRNQEKQPNKKQFGEWLRQGFEYAVRMKNRKGRGVYLKPCRTLDEAKRYAVEDYRGLMRAAWGMGFVAMGRKMPPAFNALSRLRPKILEKKTSLSDSVFNAQNMEVIMTNYVIPDGAGFLYSTDINASIASVRTMDDLMTKYFRRKFDL
jgi:hypothetical protein